MFVFSGKVAQCFKKSRSMRFYVTFMSRLLLCVYWLVAKYKSDYCLTHVDLEFPHYPITQVRVNTLIGLLKKIFFSYWMCMSTHSLVSFSSGSFSVHTDIELQDVNKSQMSKNVTTDWSDDDVHYMTITRIIFRKLFGLTELRFTYSYMQKFGCPQSNDMFC